MGSNDPSIRYQPHSRRAFLLSSPRTASNLFIRMLNIRARTDITTRRLKNGLDGGGYFFGVPVDYHDDNFGIGTPYSALSDQAKKLIGEAFQSAMDEFTSIVMSGEKQDQIVFIKEHIVNLIKPALQAKILHGSDPNSISAPWMVQVPGYDNHITSSNPLLLPDEFLHTFMPTILIRHPAISFPSEYRAEVVARKLYNTEMHDDYSKLVLSYFAVRQVYDFYSSYFQDDETARKDDKPPWPLVIDASDLIATPEPYMSRFCYLTGIDGSKLSYSWNPLTQDQVKSIGDDATCRYLDTLNASSSVQKQKAQTIVDIDAEVKKFTEEFGETIGSKMEGWIRDSMDDYEYLRSKRWVPEQKTDSESTAMDGELGK